MKTGVRKPKERVSRRKERAVVWKAVRRQKQGILFGNYKVTGSLSEDSFKSRRITIYYKVI